MTGKCHEGQRCRHQESVDDSLVLCLGKSGKNLVELLAVQGLRRRLDGVGLSGHVAIKKPLLTERHLSLHLKWALEPKNWSIRPMVQNSMARRIKISDGRVYIRRRVGEDCLPECV